jgi:2-polyprenyl-3-methyl-5-hydroxy-6-metoxy-1,4-benzoquinol methylase
MKPLSHSTAKPSHYNEEAKYYDEFNEENSQIMNRVLEAVLKKYNVKNVLDMTCGTGSQVFYLTKHGYEVVGSDINQNMLKIAKKKAKENGLKVKFLKGDMRSVQVGKFDAVITMFNAVGHLTKDDFEKAMQNIYENLNKGGIYVFDIFNFSYLMHGNNITNLTIDWLTIAGDTKVREIQYSTVDKDGILASYTTYFEQEGFDKPTKISKDINTLQVYTAGELKKMLERNRF